MLENVTLALRKLRGASKAVAIEQGMHQLTRLDMATHKDKYPSQLSGGQKQRVAIARSLAMDPVVVVFDEPTSALDPVMVREVAELMNRLHSENVTIMCVTHDLTLARLISDRVVFLDKGIVRADDTIDRLASDHADEQVRAFFGREASQ